jgi:hypothetical protein
MPIPFRSLSRISARVLVLLLPLAGCGPKDDATGGASTGAATSAPETTSTTTTGTSAPTTSSSTVGTDTGSDFCTDRSFYCMVPPGGGTSSGGDSSGGPGEPPCDEVVAELESTAQGLCASGFSALGLVTGFEEYLCCLEYMCDGQPMTCRPTAEVGVCDSETDLGGAADVAEEHCFNANSVSEATPNGDYCCATYDCTCGPTGG